MRNILGDTAGITAIMLHNMNKVRMHNVTDRFGLETVEFDPSPIQRVQIFNSSTTSWQSVEAIAVGLLYFFGEYTTKGCQGPGEKQRHTPRRLRWIRGLAAKAFHTLGIYGQADFQLHYHLQKWHTGKSWNQPVSIIVREHMLLCALQ